MAAYSAAKAGLAAFMTAASREYRRQGIRLLDARPGHIGTDSLSTPLQAPLLLWGRVRPR